MNVGTRNRFFPFTASQRQELEFQALIYKYIVSGIPMPPDLLLFIKRSFINDLPLAPKLVSRQAPHVGWGFYEVGFGRKMDPEPGRCRRTDGKKWRCSKEAYPDSKYCERHMHRGKNRSRKPVEFINNATNSVIAPNSSVLPSLYPHISATRARADSPPHQGYKSLHMFLDPSGSHSHTENGYRRMGRSIGEHAFLELSGPVSGFSASTLDDDPGQLAPLIGNAPKQRNSYSALQGSSSNYLQLECFGDEQRQKYPKTDQHCYIMGTQIHESATKFVKKNEEDREDKSDIKTVHKFFDEWPPRNRESPTETSLVSTTKLSVALPPSSYEFPVFDSIAQHDV